MTIRSKTPNTETLLCLLAGIVLIVADLSHLHLSLLGSFRELPHWKKVSNVLSLALAAYGTFFLALGLVSYAWSFRGTRLAASIVNHSRQALVELRDALSSSIRACLASRQDVAWLTAACAVGLLIRGYFLGQPMRHGESYTFLHFVKQGFFFLFYYPVPNNHVLHTLLVKLSTLIWGAHPVSIRFPAFLFGMASLPLTFCLCRKLRPERSGVLASAAMAVVPWMVLFSTNARGYSLLIFLTLALAFVGMHVAERPSLPGWALVSLLAALGMMTTPAMLFGIAGVYLWLACLLLFHGKSLAAILRDFVVPCGIMTFALTLVLYTPIIVASGGVKSIVANREMHTLTWNQFFHQVCPHARVAFWYFVKGTPRAALLMAALLLIAGMFGASRRRDWAPVVLLPAMLAGAAAVFFAKHAIPPARVWIYLLPFVFILADLGLTYLSEKLPHGLRPLLPLLLVVLASLYAVSLMSKNAPAGRAEKGPFPEAAFMAKYLRPLLGSNDLVHFKRPADEPMRFYLWYYGVPTKKGAAIPGAREEFFIVKKSRYTIEDLTEKPVIKLLDFGDTALYQLARTESEKGRSRKGTVPIEAPLSHHNRIEKGWE